MKHRTITIAEKGHCDYCESNYVVSYNDRVSICLNCGTQTIKNFPNPMHYLVKDYQKKLSEDLTGLTEYEYQSGIDKYHYALKSKVLMDAGTFYSEEKNKMLTSDQMYNLDDLIIRSINDHLMSLHIDSHEVRDILLSPIEPYDYHVKTFTDAGSQNFNHVFEDIDSLTRMYDVIHLYELEIVVGLRLMQSLILEGNGEEVIKIFNKIEELDDKAFTDESHYYYGVACTLVGELFFHLKDDNQALTYYHKADQVFEGYHIYGDYQFEYVKCLYHKGRVLERLLEFDSAEETYMKALDVLYEMDDDRTNNDQTIMLSMLYEHQAIVNTLKGCDEIAKECYIKAMGYLHDGVMIRPDKRVTCTYIDLLLNYANFLDDLYEHYNAVIYYEQAVKYLKRLDDDLHRYNLAAAAHYVSVYYSENNEPDKAMNYNLIANEALIHLCEDDEDYFDILHILHNDSK